jgi:hypothetical protein
LTHREITNRSPEPAISSAAGSATTTCSRWGSPVNHENRAEGGFFWATYKAICRRGGIFTNINGTHNFNKQLSVKPQPNPNPSFPNHDAKFSHMNPHSPTFLISQDATDFCIGTCSSSRWPSTTFSLPGLWLILSTGPSQ